MADLCGDTFLIGFAGCVGGSGFARPASGFVDAVVICGAFGAFGASGRTAIFTVEGDAQSAFAVVRAFAIFLADLFFCTARTVTIFAVFVDAVAADLGGVGMDVGVVVVAVLGACAGNTHAEPIAVFVFASGGCTATFVDRAVAVVIDAICADLGCCGQDFALTSSPFSALAGLLAGFAGADVHAVDRACETFLCLPIGALAGRCAAFVDFAIAVVVFSVVADLLGRGGHFTDTSRPDAVGADLDTFLAGADAEGSCGAAVALAAEFFVDLAVAIVVLFVALFVGGGDAAFASAPLSVATSALSFFTKSLATGFCGACIAGLGLTCGAFGGGRRSATTVRTIGIIRRDPTCFAVVRDLEPVGVSEDILPCVGAGFDFETGSFGDGADGGLAGIGTGSDIQIAPAKSGGFDVVAGRGRGRRGCGSALALGGWVAEVGAAIHPVAIEKGIAACRIDVDLKVQVGACRTTARAHKPQLIAAFDLLSDFDFYAAFFHVEVVGLFSVSVADTHIVSVARGTTA